MQTPVDPEQVEEALVQSVFFKLSGQRGVTGVLLNTTAGFTGASTTLFEVLFPTATEVFGAAQDLALGPIFNFYQQL